jgi:hypothetical protein
MKLDYRDYVKTDTPYYKNKTSAEIEYLLMPEEKDRIRTKFFMDVVLMELSEIKEILKKNADV